MRIQIAINQEERRLKHSTCYGERDFLSGATDLKIFGFGIDKFLADFRGNNRSLRISDPNLNLVVCPAP